MQVKCNNCGFEFASNAKPENIEAGKIKCKNTDPACESTDLAITEGPILETPPLNAEEREAAAEKARRAEVDAKNEKAKAEEESKLDDLADTPLNAEELAFCLETKSKMNNGRRRDMPCSADILRYSKLNGRMDIKAGGE